MHLRDVDALARDVDVPLRQWDEAARLVDALDDARIRIVAVHGLADVVAGAGRRLVDLRHQADVGTADMRDRLAQRATRQDVAVAEDVHRVDEQDVEVALELPVLVAVIEDGDLRAEVLHRVAARLGALRADEHGDLRQVLGEHVSLVAGLRRIHVQALAVGDDADLAVPLGTVAAVEDDDAVAHVADVAREALRRRRLARTADRHVAEADDEAVELRLLEDATPVTGQLDVDKQAIDQREDVEDAHDDVREESVHFFTMDKVDEIGLEVRDLLGGAHVVPVLGAALVGVEHLVEQDGRLARSTLVLAHDGARLLLHAMAMLRLVEEARDLCRQLRAVLHRQAGVAVLEERVRVLEVEHVRADDDGLAVCGRLEDVVAAVWHEAAADEDDVADAVDLAELTDRVEDDDILPLRHLVLEFRARRDREAGLAAEVHDLRRAQELARRDDEARVRMRLAHGLEGLQHGLLLTAVRRAREEDAVILGEPHLLDDALLLLGADIRVRLVEFRVARDRHELLRCTEAHDVLRIDWRLHREELDRPDHVAQQAVQMLVLLDALVADAAVDHHDRHVDLARRAQEVRPELRLDRQEDARPDAAQHVAGKPRQVEWEVDDGVGILDDAVGHLVAARRDDRDEDRALRELPAELLDQRARRDDLADGSRVHPDAVLLLHLVEGMLGEEAQALPDAFDKAFLTHRADHEHRDDQDHDDDARYIIQ